MSIRLSRQLSAATALDLPAWSTGPGADDDLFAAAADAGYEGVQVFRPGDVGRGTDAGLDHMSGIGSARTIDEVDAAVGRWSGLVTSLSLHLGTGFESAGEADELVGATIDAAERHAVAVLVETHRATLLQDPARALALVDDHPGLRFTADLSHWYTGVELVYGDLDAKLAALQPVFDRCRMIHGRISDPGCIQVAVAESDPSPHVAHFRRMWSTIAAACAASDETEELPFVVELLPASAGYARTVQRGGIVEEETDRWAQADLLWRIAADLDAVPTS